MEKVEEVKKDESGDDVEFPPLSWTEPGDEFLDILKAKRQGLGLSPQAPYIDDDDNH